MTVKKYNIIGILLVAAITHCVLANSLSTMVQQANDLYQNKRYNDAINAYDKALVDNPQSLELKFNKADCYFQLDDIDKAIDLYNEVAAESKDMTLVEKAKYNLGNCYFHRGSSQKDSNLQKAMDDLKTSIKYWRSALDIRPENEKAAKNIEVARLVIKDIIDQINKQKEQQKQQAQQQKQLQEQLQELTKQQKSLAQKTRQTKKEVNQGQISPQQAQQQLQQQAQEQSQLRDKTENTLQQIQQQRSDPVHTQPMAQARAELEQAVKDQSTAQSHLNASAGDQAVTSEDKAAEHLENAVKILSENNQANQQQQQQKQQQKEKTQQHKSPKRSQEQQQKQQQSQPKKQQAQAAPSATAQDILDKEQQEKKQRQMVQNGGYQNVEKDW